MIHLAAFCTLSGAVQGAWMYFAGNPFRTGKYFLKTIHKIVPFRTDFLRWSAMPKSTMGSIFDYFNPALHPDDAD